MTTATFLLDLAAAVGTGGLVGIEREHRREQTQVIAGVRTFPLISTAGFLTAVLGTELASPWPVTLGAVGILLVGLGFFYVRFLSGNLGFTTPMAIVVTYLAGALIGIGFLLEAVVVSVATTFLLLTKDRLHRLAETLDQEEIMGAIQFTALAFVAFPLATQADGPYLGGLVGEGRPIDLQWTLLIVVAASALAFVSFVALRQLGGHGGMATAGALGGLVNSEAATASVAAISKATPNLVPAAATAVLAATGTSLVRNLVLAGISDPSLQLVWPFAIVVAVPVLLIALWAVWLARRGDGAQAPEDIGLSSPFAIKPALTFALVFTAVNAAAFLLKDLAGPLGVYATSIGAFVSSGAVVASAANLVFTGTVSLNVGLITAALATVFSMASKLGILLFSNREVLRDTWIPVTLSAVATGISLLAVL